MACLSVGWLSLGACWVFKYVWECLKKLKEILLNKKTLQLVVWNSLDVHIWCLFSLVYSSTSLPIYKPAPAHLDQKILHLKEKDVSMISLKRVFGLKEL